MRCAAEAVVPVLIRTALKGCDANASLCRKAPARFSGGSSALCVGEMQQL